MKKLFFIVLFIIGLFHTSAMSFAGVSATHQFSKATIHSIVYQIQVTSLPEVWLADTESDDLQEQENHDNSDYAIVSLLYNSSHLTFLHPLKGVVLWSSEDLLPNSLFLFYSVFRI